MTGNTVLAIGLLLVYTITSTTVTHTTSLPSVLLPLIHLYYRAWRGHIQQTREDGTHPAGEAGYVNQYFDGVQNDDLRLLRDIAYSSPLQAEVKTSCGIFFYNYKSGNISSYWFCFNRGRNVEVSANAFKNSI